MAKRVIFASPFWGQAVIDTIEFMTAVADGHFAPRRARNLRFAAAFWFRSSSTNSRHSAMFVLRASRAQHLRHQNRVRFVTPAGAGIGFSPQMQQLSWASGARSIQLPPGMKLSTRWDLQKHSTD